MSRILILCCSSVLALCPVASAEAMDTYHIGNSLTWDAGPPVLEKLAASAGHAHYAGYHIRSAAPLHYIQANPSDTTYVRPSQWDTAFARAEGWDAISIQPYPAGGATLASDAAAITTFIAAARENPASGSTNFYIYAAWPHLQPAPGESYSQHWLGDWDSGAAVKTRNNLEYFTTLIGQVRASQPDVMMIPVGEALHAVEQQILAGNLPGLEGGATFYRDPYHMANVGRYVASLTFLATFYGQSPEGLPMPVEFAPNYTGNWANDRTISADNSLRLQTIVWDVVRNNAYSGVPEPAGLTLALTGALALLVRRPVKIVRLRHGLRSS